MASFRERERRWRCFHFGLCFHLNSYYLFIFCYSDREIEIAMTILYYTCTKLNREKKTDPLNSAKEIYK